MRVLHVIPSLAKVHGGPSQAIAMFEQACQGQAIEIDVASTDDEGPGKRKPSGESAGKTSESGTRYFFRKNSDFYKVSFALFFWLWKNIRHYDVVHIHALFSFSSTVSSWIARRKKVPYVIRPLGTLNHYGRQQRRPWLKSLSIACIEGPALKSAAAVHFTSHAEQSEAETLKLPLRPVILPLAVQPAAAGNGSALRDAFPVLSDRPYLLFMSRLDPKKNIEGLLRAIKQVKSEMGNEYLCVIAGDGLPEYVADLRKLASELELDSCLVWTGHLEAEQKTAALAGADIFVLPSYSENFGIAAAEALLAGVPCVLGHGVALARDAESAGAAMVVSPEPESIAFALKRLIKEKDLRVQSGLHAREFAERNYSIAAMGLGLQKLYDGIMQARKNEAQQ